MSRLQIPIIGKVLWATGDVKLWVNVELLLKDRSGGWWPETFRMDTATDITTFPAYEAKRLDLALPAQVTPSTAHAQTGLEIRSGILLFQNVGMDQTEYAVPGIFLGDPDAPLAGPSVAQPRKLLQPLALLGPLRFTLDKDPTGSLYGELVVEKQ